MKKLLLTLSVALLSLSSISAQNAILSQKNSSNQTNEEKCGFDTRHQQLMSSDLMYKQKTEDFNLLMSKGGVNNKAGTVYRVPVVVHVMYKGEAIGSGSNISEAAINQGILQLNERFRKVPGSLGDGNGVDVEIEFALAVRDELNNCTNGIVRYDMSSHSNYMNYGMNYYNSNGMDESTLKALSRWDPTEYYNIYLVYEIDDNECGFGIQGFAYFASSHGNSLDGMIQLACKFAESGNTTLTHELGHALNLYHTFEGDGGGGSCPTGNGDYCADTPEHKRSTSNCVVATNTCTGGSSSDHIHNYMDYSSDACQSEFTDDQRTRGRTALTVTRSSFLESNGNQSLVPPATAGVDFSASSYAICLGSSVSFYDESSCVPNTYQNGGWTGISFNWTFDDGVNPPLSSTDQNPSMTFVNAGSYDVTLEVTNGYGTTSSTKNGFVIVSAGLSNSTCENTSNNTGNYGYTISSVKFNAINGSSSSSNNGAWQDFSCSENTQVDQGQSYNLSVTVNSGSSGFGYEFIAYIDYNNDGAYSAGEQVMTNSIADNTSQTFVQSVTIPGTSNTGELLRLRVIGDAGTVTSACESPLLAGDVEDYGVYINSACTDPDVPVLSSAPTICVGANTNLSVSSGNLNDAADWQWYTVSCGGTSAGSGSTINVSPTVTTTYYVRGEGGCVSPGTCESVIVTVNDVPGNAGTITGSASECENASGVPYSIVAVAGATNYDWILPTGATIASGAGTNSITVNFGSTSGNVDVTPTNICGSGGNSSKTVTINVCAGAPVADFSGSSTNICEGSTTSFTDLSTNSPTSWSWTFTGGTPSSSTAQNPTITYNTAGTYDVTLTATNASGSDPITKIGYITVAASGVNVDSTKIRAQDCGKTLITTKDVVYADIVTNATNYQFKVTNTGLGFTDTTGLNYTANYIRLMDRPGILPNTTYDIQVRARIGVCNVGTYGTVCQVTTPNTSVPPTQITTKQCGFTFNNMTDVMYADGVVGATDYIIEVTNTGLGYSLTKTGWNGGRGIRLSQFQGLQLSTTYNVRAKVIVGGNTGNYGKTCQITTPATVRLANPFDEENKILDNIYVNTLNMKIYPNPSQGEFVYLALQGLLANSELVVTDIFGKRVLKQPLNSDYSNYNGTLRFDKKLGAGFYLVTVVSGNQKTTKKLIVQ
jgi:PKD repeat protein